MRRSALGGEPRRVMVFIGVGCVAAAVHWAVVVSLVEHASWRPLLANLAGWLVAFGISFTGHHRLSFRGHGTPLVISATRFFVVSAIGFAANEMAYAVLLHVAAYRYDLLLAVVLVGVALVTYWLSRHWAFLSNATTP